MNIKEVAILVKLSHFHELNFQKMADLEKITTQNIKLIGQRIKALRKAKGYTNQEKFAFKFNIARAQYSRYERGADLRISSLSKILLALDVSLVEFFSDGFEETLDE